MGSREQRRRAKELDEARKLGTVPAEQDEEGRDINPHIPQYIVQAPWYYATEGPTLKHQRNNLPRVETSTIHEHYERGKQGPRARKFRKGACANCGAMTHKKKDCLERPRKLGAKWTSKDIAADEQLLPDLKLSFDGKRDRWAGYDVNNHRKIVQQYEKVDKLKKKLKAEQLKKELREATDEKEEKAAAAEHSDSSDASESDDDVEEKYAEEADQAGSKFDTKNRQTVRNLRIREDTAKYLRNLDPNSAYYDPKTRTMRSNPTPDVDPSQLTYAGDNFVRYTGDVKHMARKQIFAWQAAEKGADVNMQADPTKLELMYKDYEVKKDKFKDTQRESILAKYGGEEHLKVPARDLLMAQSEAYVEYSKFGRIIKGDEKPKARSKYDEDVHPGNHTSIWGSYWKDGKWGYACCHALEKAAYCAGEQGRVARAEQTDDMLAVKQRQAKDGDEGGDEGNDKPVKSLVEEHLEKKEASRKDKKKKKQKRRKKKKRRGSDDSDASGSDDVDSEAEREKRIQAFMKQHEKDAREAERLMKMDERARPFNSGKRSHQEVSEEEMEAFRRKRVKADDPMKAYL